MFFKNVQKGKIVVETVTMSRGLRPYSSASWPRRGSTTILKIPTTYPKKKKWGENSPSTFSLRSKATDDLIPS